MLMQALVEAKLDDDRQEFIDAIADYEYATKLDDWKALLLMRVQERLTVVAEGEEEPENQERNEGDSDEGEQVENPHKDLS